MDKGRLWEKVRKCELTAQKLSLDLKGIWKELIQLEEVPEVTEKIDKS